VTSNYIIFVAAKEENVYVCATSTQYRIISYHYSDHLMEGILSEHNPVWIKNLCDTKLHNYRTEQTASERTFASFSL